MHSFVAENHQKSLPSQASRHNSTVVLLECCCQEWSFDSYNGTGCARAQTIMADDATLSTQFFGDGFPFTIKPTNNPLKHAEIDGGTDRDYFYSAVGEVSIYELSYEKFNERCKAPHHQQHEGSITDVTKSSDNTGLHLYSGAHVAIRLFRFLFAGGEHVSGINDDRIQSDRNGFEQHLMEPALGSKTVLELGCGCGALGLIGTLGLDIERLVLTDGSEECIRIAQMNTELLRNKHETMLEQRCRGSSRPQRGHAFNRKRNNIHSTLLRWDFSPSEVRAFLDANNDGRKFDIVLGSELAYYNTDMKTMARCVTELAGALSVTDETISSREHGRETIVTADPGSVAAREKDWKEKGEETALNSNGLFIHAHNFRKAGQEDELISAFKGSGWMTLEVPHSAFISLAELSEHPDWYNVRPLLSFFRPSATGAEQKTAEGATIGKGAQAALFVPSSNQQIAEYDDLAANDHLDSENDPGDFHNYHDNNQGDDGYGDNDGDGENNQENDHEHRRVSENELQPIFEISETQRAGDKYEHVSKKGYGMVVSPGANKDSKRETVGDTRRDGGVRGGGIFDGEVPLWSCMSSEARASRARWRIFREEFMNDDDGDDRDDRVDDDDNDHGENAEEELAYSLWKMLYG